MGSKEHSCCIFGHRKIDETEQLINNLHDIIENLITNEKVDTFFFGSKSEFDDLCYQIVTELKEKYAFIKRIYVRAEFPEIEDSYKKYLLKRFEDTYYPKKIKNAGKASYIERNFEMIDKSNFCICYYNTNYLPPKRKSSQKDLTTYQPKSGTKIAYDYARKKKCRVINMAEILK